MSTAKSCALCQKSEPVFRCSKCRVESYCCAKCQEVYWPIHRYFCGHDRTLFRYPDLSPKEEAWNKRLESSSIEGMMLRKLPNLVVLTKEEELERKDYLTTSNPTPQHRNNYLIYTRCRLFSIWSDADYTDVCGKGNNVFDIIHMLTFFQLKEPYLRSLELDPFIKQVFHQYTVETLYKGLQIPLVGWFSSLERVKAISVALLNTEIGKKDYTTLAVKVGKLYRNFDNVTLFQTGKISQSEFDRRDRALGASL